VTTNQRDYLVRNGASLWDEQPLPGISMDLLAGAEQTEGRYTWIRYTVQNDILPHIHHREDESIYLLDGEITVRVGEREYELTPGSFIFMPKQVPHAITMRSIS
jgi:quercetin dioxygenase-like cupin family protein